MAIDGTSKFLIENGANTYSPDVNRYEMVREEEPVEFREYDQYNSSYLEKKGNRWFYTITVYDPVAADITSLEAVGNGVKIDFTPHIDIGANEYVAWCHFAYFDYPKPHHIIINIVNNKVDVDL